jgi:hypothetical protein
MLKTIYRSVKKAAGLPWQRPGHFYSPIVDPAELRKRYAAVFNDDDPLDIDLRPEAQLAMVELLKRHYSSLPFAETKDAHSRYGYDCRNYSYGDAIIRLHADGVKSLFGKC